MTEQERWKADAALREVFQPAAPVTDSEIFEGRLHQVRRALDAINTPSQHAIIYGERGIGKTSLANILATRLTVGDKRPLVPHINCTSTDTFASLWKRVFDHVKATASKGPAAFSVKPQQIFKRLVEDLPATLDTSAVWDLLSWLPSVSYKFIVILDEFDRIASSDAKREFADTIKFLADNKIDATVIVVGVAESIGELLAEHQSVGRSLIEIHMPRMPETEIGDFLKKGFVRAKFSCAASVLRNAALLPRGLPHYAHRIGLSLGRTALDSDRLAVEEQDLLPALRRAVEDSEQSHRDAYHKATTSAHRDAYYKQVFLACALAPTNSSGLFPAGAVREPLNVVMHDPDKQYDIENYIRHIQEFCLPRRGPVLISRGEKYGRHYKFADPHLQPIILMNGVIAQEVSFETIERFVHHDQP